MWLVARHWRGVDPAARQQAALGFFMGGIAFFWQFGNLTGEFEVMAGIDSQIGEIIAYTALISFPLLFSYMTQSECRARPVQVIAHIGRVLRYFLWPWTVVAFVSGATDFPLDSNHAREMTLQIMLFFFVLFVIESMFERRFRSTSQKHEDHANIATLIAAGIAAALFMFMLWGADGTAQWTDYLTLAAQMTSVPYTIAIGYRLYQFPFMDTFVRESLSGVAVLAGFVTAVSVGSRWLSEDLAIFWLVLAAACLAFAKEPISRWVEKRLMGYAESIDEQEERVSTAIRALTRLDQFTERVSEILKLELDAQWVEIGSEPIPKAVQQFEIAGPSLLWLSLGPRVGSRQYMSRHLRLVRTAALQLAAHHHQLSQHELREATARAQIRALQAQINPHFLFNTLNVLANLIHTNPAKAERVIEELAEIFRYALESTQLEWVNVEDEVHFLGAYLEIEKARFEDRLSYTFDIDPTVRSMRIPPMILQPIVENAVKHGLSPKVEGGSVRLSATLRGDRLVVVVEDTGTGYPGRSRSRGNGIGLANVRKRLQHIYGEASSVLRIEKNEPAGTRVVIDVPQATGVHSCAVH
jgi:signal transduction histidine kinase